MTRIITLLLLIMVAGCTGKDGSFDMRKPYSMDLTPPEGPYEYEQGWTDGCESGMQAYTTDTYKLLGVFDFKQDAELRYNRMYYQAWKDAFLWCGLYWESTRWQKI